MLKIIVNTVNSPILRTFRLVELIGLWHFFGQSGLDEVKVKSEGKAGV